MINKNRRPRYIRYFYNPDRHPDPTPEDLARTSSDRACQRINELSGMARLMLWKLIVRKYGDELRAEMLKQQRNINKQKANTKQKQKS
ncbi:MAG: hypothetical protein K2L25_02250 [Alphaproteobacteria bacterium]|nr:hypothetical protein [Alphaproteobacteria bacterium]